MLVNPLNIDTDSFRFIGIRTFMRSICSFRSSRVRYQSCNSICCNTSSILFFL